MIYKFRTMIMGAEEKQAMLLRFSSRMGRHLSCGMIHGSRVSDVSSAKPALMSCPSYGTSSRAICHWWAVGTNLPECYQQSHNAAN